MRYLLVIAILLAACETSTEVHNITCAEIVIYPNASDPLRADSISFFRCSSPTWDGETIRVVP